MFSVVTVRGHDLQDRRVLYTGFRTVAEARDARAVSGDLVVHGVTGTLVPSLGWLWDWEMADEQSFAQQMLRRYCIQFPRTSNQADGSM